MHKKRSNWNEKTAIATASQMLQRHVVRRRGKIKKFNARISFFFSFSKYNYIKMHRNSHTELYEKDEKKWRQAFKCMIRLTQGLKMEKNILNTYIRINGGLFTISINIFMISDLFLMIFFVDIFQNMILVILSSLRLLLKIFMQISIKHNVIAYDDNDWVKHKFCGYCAPWTYRFWINDSFRRKNMQRLIKNWFQPKIVNCLECFCQI